MSSELPLYSPPSNASFSFHLPPLPPLANVSALLQCRDLLGDAANTIHSAKFNKAAVCRLLTRAHSILASLNDYVIASTNAANTRDNLGAAAGSGGVNGVSAAIHNHIDTLVAILTGLNGFLSKMVDSTFMATVVNKELIVGKLLLISQELTTLAQDLSLSIQIDSRLWAAEDLEDRKLDNQELEQTLQHLVDNDYKILNALELKQVEYVEAMEALQKNLAQHVDQALEKSLDRIFLDRALACLRRATAATHPHLINDNNASSSRSTPEWLLTSWEIELGPVISMGGFGEVLKGTWLGHHPVAVKRLHMRLETAKLEKEFLREVKTWFPLRHPNILPLLGACASSPRPFMVSPLMTHGHSLQYLDWCERSFGPACVEERGIKLLYEVSLGLQYLHTRSVIHGDLKAVNVLIDEHCNACVADFGFASLKQYATSRMTTTTGGNNNFGGTLRWMSPERLQGGKLAPAVDVYAFAMTSYEVLSEGEVPLTDTPDGLIYQHVVHSNVRPELPEPSASTTYFRTSKALFCLMEQCWSPNPMARPSFSTISLHLKKLHSLAKSKSIDAIDVDQQEIVHAMKSLSSDESTTPATETMVTESMKSSSTTSDSSTSLAFQSAKEVPDSSSHLMAPLTNNIQPARTFSASTTTSGSAASGVTTKTTTKILLAKTGTHEFHLLPNVVIQTIGRGTVHLTIKTPKPHITVYAPTTTVTTAPPSSSVAANTPPITAPTLIYELGTKGITPEGSRIILEQDSNTLYFTVRFPAVGDLFTKLSHSNLVAKLTLVVPQQQQQKQQQLDSPSASTTTNPTQETTTTTTTTTTSPTFESIKIGCEDSLFVNWNAEMLEAGLVAFSNVIHVCAKRSLDVKGVMSGYQELVLDSEYANLDFLLFPGGGGGTGGGGGGARGVGSAVASLATKQIVKVRKGVVKVVVHGFNGLFTTSVKFGSVKLYGSKRWNKETGKRFDCLGSFSVLDQVGREEGLGEFEMLLGKTRVDIEFVE